jgi:hypothetical protein
MSQLESLCASGACEEKAKVERSYSNSHPKKIEWEPVRLWSMSLGVRIFCSFTPKKKQCECGFELVRLWSMWRKGQSEAFVLKLTPKKTEWVWVWGYVAPTHPKKRVSLGLRIFCSYTPKKTEWVWVWVWRYFAPTHPRKNKVSVGLSLCASGACEEKAKVNRAYSNSLSLWPLCPEQESLTAVRQGTCTIFLIKYLHLFIRRVLYWTFKVWVWVWVWRKGQSEACVLKLTLTLAFVPRTGIPDCRQAGNLHNIFN